MHNLTDQVRFKLFQNPWRPNLKNLNLVAELSKAGSNQGIGIKETEMALVWHEKASRTDIADEFVIAHAHPFSLIPKIFGHSHYPTFQTFLISI